MRSVLTAFALALFALTFSTHLERTNPRVSQKYIGLQSPGWGRLQTWVLRLNPKLPAEKATSIARLVFTHCDPALQRVAVAIIFLESSFNHTAVSQTGDYGYGQINATIHGIPPRQLLEPETNISHMCTLLRTAWLAGDYTRYHSKTPSIAKRYRRKVNAILRRLRYENT